jgi:polysaccharide pyruvyl transferase WcaK-like protein
LGVNLGGEVVNDRLQGVGGEEHPRRENGAFTTSINCQREEGCVPVATNSGAGRTRARAKRWLTRNLVLPKKIGLFGLFGCGNSGNDGSLEAILIFLRRVTPDAELACICPWPDKSRWNFGIPTLAASSCSSGKIVRFLDRLLLGGPGRVGNWIYTITHVHKFDLIIIPGTGILDDFGTGPWFIPYVLFRWCLSARLCRTQIWFISIGAGPIHHPMSRRLMKWAAAMAQYRSYRDTISKEFMESVGVDVCSDRVYPDLAFRLPSPKSSRFNETPLTVALGVMSYRGWRSDLEPGDEISKEYLKKLTRFLIWVLDRGYHVRLLTGDSSDQPAVDNLMKAVTTERRNIEPEKLVAEPMPTLHDVMRQISLTDIVIATRFHNVVCALKLGKPTISVGYSNKNDVLLVDMGLGAFCQHIEKFDVDLLIEQFTALMADRHEYEQTIEKTVRAYHQQLADQEAILTSKLLEL